MVCGGGYPCGDYWTGCGYPCGDKCHGGGYPCGYTSHGGGYPCGDTCHGMGIPAEIHVTGVGIPAEIQRIHSIEIIGLHTPEKCQLLSFFRRVFTCLSFLVLSPFFETFSMHLLRSAERVFLHMQRSFAALVRV